MSKSLELVVHPPLPPEPLPYTPEWVDWDNWREWDQRKRQEFQQVRSTHFTDAELAAEYWRSWNLFKTATITSDRDWAEYDRSQTILRFATHPHHTEVAA